MLLKYAPIIEKGCCNFIIAFHFLRNCFALAHSIEQHIQQIFMAATAAKRLIVVDAFCLGRQGFSKTNAHLSKSHHLDVSVDAFEAHVNAAVSSESDLKPGYAPFCKHVFVKNDITSARVAALRITPENEALLKSGYEARNEKELPVLGRWFDAKDADAPVATFLDVILYSRDQIRKENEAMGVTAPSRCEEHDAPWGVVSVKPQDCDHELPMQPITMMRNALGRDQGGSGVELSRAAYAESVAFWKEYAVIK